MNIELKQPVRAQRSKLHLVDVDIHPKARSLEDLGPYLSTHWRHYLETYGTRSRHGYVKGYPYPKASPLASRRDSWPPGGGYPASDLAFMQAQHLDFYGVDYAIMNPLSPTGQGDQNVGLSTALAFAANEWQLETFARRDPRLKASIIVPYEDAEASRAEIKRRAGDKHFAHVFFLSRTSEALGRRRYWPIFEAAVEHGLPVAIHVFGYSGWAITNSGWASFYIEEMTEHATSCQAVVTSMIMEGVFERYPDLKVVMLEAGFGWLPALGWRLDKHWKRLRDEVPHLKRAPSEYIREHFWAATQPMEETERPEHLIDLMDWLGWDRILYSSDYPHWDFDDPLMALPPSLDESRRRKILSGNARALYRFD